MKNDNVMYWARELQTTSKMQARKHLKVVLDFDHLHDAPIIGYCCMGVGCELVPSIPTWGETDVNDMNVGDVWRFGQVGQEGMPPREFHEWLGTDGHEGQDVYLDAGDVTVRIPDGVAGFLTTEVMLRHVGCSTLNDQWNLTFSQIGDLIAYFGVRDQNH